MCYHIKCQRKKLLSTLKMGFPIWKVVFEIRSTRRCKSHHRSVSIGVGYLSNVKSVRKGVFEYEIDFGPGYRMYFGQHGNLLVILLGGGTKKSQNKDIKSAQLYWAQYKRSNKK